MRPSLRRIGVITSASVGLVALAALPASAATVKPMPAKVKVTQTCLVANTASAQVDISLKNMSTHPVTSASWYWDAQPQGAVAIPGTNAVKTSSFTVPAALASKSKHVLQVNMTNSSGGLTVTKKNVTIKTCR